MVDPSSQRNRKISTLFHFTLPPVTLLLQHSYNRHISMRDFFPVAPPIIELPRRKIAHTVTCTCRACSVIFVQSDGKKNHAERVYQIKTLSEKKANNRMLTGTSAVLLAVCALYYSTHSPLVYRLSPVYRIH